MRRKKDIFPDNIKQGLAFAHRGLHDLGMGIAENSLPAFERACRYGFGIELDVRLSKEGTPHVFHDATLKRVCGIKKQLSELSDRDLRAARLFSTDERIPTLAEMLDLIGGRVPLLVELKNDGNPKPFAKTVSAMLAEYKGFHLVQSFDPRLLREYSRRSPDTPCGLLATRLRENGEKIGRIIDFTLRNLMTGFIHRPDFIAFEYSKRARLSAFARRIIATRPELGWTIRTPEDFQAARRDGVIPIFEGFIPGETV